MGYYVRLTDSEVVLKEKDQAQILQRWKDLNGPENNSLKSGGGYSNGEKTQHWFSWMPENYDQTVENPQEVLELLGFKCEALDNGDLAVVNYDSKTGNEDVFFKAIADLIAPGSTMMWHGEDGATFAWYFDGKTMVEMDMKSALKKAVAQEALNKASIEKPQVKELTEKEKLNHRYKSLL